MDQVTILWLVVAVLLLSNVVMCVGFYLENNLGVCYAGALVDRHIHLD